MDIQSSELNEVFVLYPIIIQGWVTPVKPDGIAHGGIPKLLYDGEPQGLECLVDPWSELRLFNSTMAVDDRVDLYVNDDITPAVGETIAPGEEQLRVRLYLPHGRLNHGVNRLYYKVTRAGGNIETSRDLRVLYHLRIAEGLDLVIPPDVLSDGVDAARATQGVEFGFTYNNRRAYDRIEFRPGDTSILFDVPNAPAAVTQTLFTDAFQKAGDNPSAVAEFYVIDQLGNRSKSPEKRVDIHLSRLNLPAPTVKGQIGNNFSPTQPELRVLVPRGALLLSDLLSVIWQGATGIAAGSYTSTPRLVSAGLEIAVPRSVLAYSLAKVVTVTYVIERNGVRSTSLPLKLNILALPATALNPPKIIEADANNFLDVIALGTKNATIHGLLWTLIEVGQQVWLKLEGKKANGTAHNLTIWNGSGHYVNGTWVAQGFWPRSLVNSYLKELGDGSTLTLKFKAALDKSNIQANAVVFPDRVYTIRAAALLSPTITSVKGSPSNVEIANGASTSDTTLVFSGKAAPGQQIELRDKGVVKATVAVDAADNWNHTLTGQAIGAHSYTAKAKYGTLPESVARTLTVVALILQENFDSYSTRIISVGEHISLPSMKIYFLSGSGYLGITSLSSISEAHGGPFSAIPNQSAGQILEMHVNASGTSQTMRIRFNWGYSNVSCYWRFVQFNDILVSFLNEQNQQLHTTYLLDKAEPQLVSYGTAENSIWGMEIKTPRMDLIAMDHVRLQRK
ncbi:hypothetical protein FHW68_001906 [Pseudomonas sp. Tn43]|uniref:hypothetical protein n=1 Tax=Pseudomonas sp. Tn43 TaxID=701213 RepID=UPI00160EE342|nr:hypothetical protein [Pseudomonas sp. Tn43]MBB3240399.1 hypothetical protein [Pseudomonas sp. Tn43]